MDDEQKQKRLANLAKARQRIIELREEKKSISKKTKDEERFKKEIDSVAKMVENMEEKAFDVVDTADKKDDVKEEPVEKPVKEEVVKEEPVKEEPENKVKKTYVKKPKPIIHKTEPIVIDQKPVKLTFQRGNDGLFYM
tara:strand:+ start:346 stop:759 length:414 start_codon:yes stop_codon:yes gene_type:complete